MDLKTGRLAGHVYICTCGMIPSASGPSYGSVKGCSAHCTHTSWILNRRLPEASHIATCSPGDHLRKTPCAIFGPLVDDCSLISWRVSGINENRVEVPLVVLLLNYRLGYEKYSFTKHLGVRHRVLEKYSGQTALAPPSPPSSLKVFFGSALRP